MPKYLGIDYGQKRCGLAITDSLGMIAGAYKAISTTDFYKELSVILPAEKIDCVVLGMPHRLHGEKGAMAQEVESVMQELEKRFPQLEITSYDERFTSRMASDTLVQMGAGKKDRQHKENTDVIAAVIMLRDYLASKNHQNDRNG